MTAWQILTSNSTLPSGTAWQHLNSQGGGGGSGVIVNDGIDVEVQQMNVEIELDVTTLEVEASDATIAVEYANEPIELEVEEW